MTAARMNLDNLFPYDLDEMIERALLPYAPVLSHMVMATFRTNLQISVTPSDNLLPWVETLRPWAPAPIRPTGLGAEGGLTAAQVALLGGTRPTRLIHVVASDLDVHLDGGSRDSAVRARRFLMAPYSALGSLVEHHVVAPAPDRSAAARHLRELIDLGVVAQVASMLGELLNHGFVLERRLADDDRSFLEQYFVRTLRAFGSVELTRKDQAVFEDYYVEQADPEEIAEERYHELHEEVERRRAFLKRLGAALKAQIDFLAPEDSADPRSASWPRRLPASAAASRRSPKRLPPKKKK